MGTKFVIKLGAWFVLMLYLYFDLILLDGPLKRQVLRLQGTPEEAIAHDIERGIVARVFGQPILLSQVNYAVDEHLWRSGRSKENASESELRSLKTIALNELIDHAILRKKVDLNHKEFPVSEEEITAGMKRFASRFSTTDEMINEMQQFGFDGEKELRFRIAARIQQNKYLEKQIAPGIAVSDKEAKDWYEEHQAELTTPELRNVRHIFLAHLENDPIKAEQTLQNYQIALASKEENFETLATRYSDDERSKSKGGKLGWMSKNRLPEDSAREIFGMSLQKPTLVQTSIGWHLVEVTEIREPHLRSFAELKPEIVAALETTRRKKAVQEYRKNLRLQHPSMVRVHRELLK